MVPCIVGSNPTTPATFSRKARKIRGDRASGKSDVSQHSETVTHAVTQPASNRPGSRLRKPRYHAGPYLMRRGRIFYFRKRLPKRLSNQVPNQFLCLSLRTDLPLDAVKRAAYDRVAEFACNSKNVLFQTGFAPGYIQKWESTGRIKMMHGSKPSRIVKIWKVHGSLDWFRTADERTIGLPVFELPSSELCSPLIVTPGLNKYEKTSEDPFRTTINGADEALKTASAFLCVGFGFRDKHIHPKIIERCRERNVPTVVLARSLTDEAKEFLKNNAGTKYLGIEKSGSGSRVFSPAAPDGFEVGTPDLWSLDGFNSLVL